MCVLVHVLIICNCCDHEYANPCHTYCYIYFLPMHTHTQARKGSGASGKPEGRKTQQRHNANCLRMFTLSQPMTVSILHIAAFHVGDMPWLFLFHLCVPTHFVFFLLFISVSAHTHTQARQVVSMCVCACTCTGDMQLL